MTSIATDAKNSSLTQHMDITITHCDQEELAGRLHDAFKSLGFSTIIINNIFFNTLLGKLVVVVITDSYFNNSERVRLVREAVQAGARIQPVVHAKDKTRKDELLKLAPEDLQLLGEIKWVVLDEIFLQLLGEIKWVVDITITHCDQEELAGRLHDAFKSLGFSTIIINNIFFNTLLGKLVVVVITDSYFNNSERVRLVREAVQAGARIQPVVHAKDKTRKWKV